MTIAKTLVLRFWKKWKGKTLNEQIEQLVTLMDDLYVDAHCHVTTSLERRNVTPKIPEAAIERCFMSNNTFDWHQIKLMKSSNNMDLSSIGFGVHPWYSHLYYTGEAPATTQSHYLQVLQGGTADELEQIIAQLPPPINLSEYIANEFDPVRVCCVGEIGLDKLFRLPKNGFYQGDQHAPLGRVRVRMEHQVQIFKALCALAVRHSLPVSIHCVKCPSLMYDLCKEHLLPHAAVKICLHSFTGSLETLESFWLAKFPHERLFVSVSRYINFKNTEPGIQLLQKLPLKCVLTETDFTWDTTESDQLLQELEFLVRQIARAHELDSFEVAKGAIYQNFQRFKGH
ncbi:LAQU0S03e02872g1_1 [Lachancea quebecensis]|uniref:LAQU0S03e02872g1_1 n=1 Tax=Lachancea quebecensis TaxID=1654605 RepID=A0A0P1KRE1_9SACH|nr:LAQU0S03e02872g1_1 [Lachancea quebecensis]